ncbi:2Fe-2S iron-sulfur cluster-binding protein [Caballeronia sp. LjRoot34]|uniref:2Fe-2S iron-sulfur cluster-binding protein n=1 Tax=Caballeronia sp. LjRoot34 TaxID=3342325 RepID=UPI003ED1666A
MSTAGHPRSFTITLRPSGRSFASTGDTTILEAAALAGLRLSSSCRNGTCRACLCHVVNGSVRYRIDWPGLSADEKASGWILPCVALPTSDLIIDQVDFLDTPNLADTKPRRGRGF